MASGALIVSLDFELQWGLRHDPALADAYRQNVLGVRTAIPAMLDLFRRYEIHATWAAVGFLFFENRRDLMRGLPAIRPHYVDPRYSPYAELATIGEDEASDPYHFAGSLLRQIASTPHQEIASHTFSHYHCFEEGRDLEAFKADLLAGQQAAAGLGVRLESLVFPRNQYDPGYVAVAASCGIRAFRGRARSWIWRARRNEDDLVLVRYLRRLDSYINLTGHNCFTYGELMRSTPYDIPGSRFLRPYAKRFGPVTPLALRRHKREMEYAANNDRVYHMWWHPENFGQDLARNLGFLEELLIHQRRLGLRSMNMRELAADLDASRALPNG